MNKFWSILFILATLAMFSCRSSKDLMYLQVQSGKGLFKGLPKQSTEHVLMPGDILYVSIKTMNADINALYNPESSMEGNTSSAGYQKYSSPSSAYLYGFEIDADGIIKLPMLGDLKVNGVTLKEAEKVIKKKTDEFINDAIVNVKLLNFSVTVMGEVKSPGLFFNYKNSITVLEALAMANGNTDYATIKKVMVVRPDEGGYQYYTLDLSSKDIFVSEAFYLQPNDYVIVQPDKYKNFQLNSQVYSLIFSSVSILLAVLAFALK